MSVEAATDSAIIAQRSKSFSLASRLLEPRCREAAHAVYAWCRRADDAVDEASVGESVQQAVTRLFAELDALEDGAVGPPAIQSFARAMRVYRIPVEYPRELVRGMEMDALGAHYDTWDDLELYCYRAAGTVGLMMTHVFGIESAHALRHAAHLGMGMQLTNIARDIVEDWQRQRLYVPRQVLRKYGIESLADDPGGSLPPASVPGLTRCVAELVGRSQRYYASGAEGLGALAPRHAFAVRTAGLIYAEIGEELRHQNYDPTRGRAYVSSARKLWLLATAASATLTDWMRARPRAFVPQPSLPICGFNDVLPL
jgi:15-cis-phytoene synthase